MLIGTMIPIPTVKRQVVCDSNNFRAIALSCIIGKGLDWIILMKEETSLCSLELQFGVSLNIYVNCMSTAEYDINFNGSKRTYMLYIGRECAVFYTDIFVNDFKVEQVTSADHLGHKLSTVNKHSMVNTAQSQFWRSCNLLWSNLDIA